MYMVLSKIHMLRGEHKHMSKRDVYYNNVPLFTTQRKSDEAIDRATSVLGIPRYMTNIVPSPKGLIAGDISYTIQGRRVIHTAGEASLVPTLPELIEGVVTSARWLLVVEKEAVFSRLLEDGVPRGDHCCPGIIVTGKGYPDYPTKQLIRAILDATGIPALCLVDGDPHGYEIFTTYRDSSDKFAVSLPEMQLVGITAADVVEYDLQPALMPLTEADRAKARSVIGRLGQVDAASLNAMVEANGKCEIEALHLLGLGFVSEVYVPDKIAQLGQ
ncbi:Spo11/DNA topoisomerase VI subunit A [Carpediemonas membranifera]|uniref:DNA topoisomerase (ATP-hydrolyzing) n=1 Tax=Carpediemonas membranifera TaxID=201153 RepID=A0A8J6DXU7_9EUKA|nr:Spo11/DNA topoisomerase VI subunit A [Carpediemonas membranifera]|eukprot:KAG9391029.1 Spo11/DNA topoisomerase VI subunit A [Carpediemonas membranifera]